MGIADLLSALVLFILMPILHHGYFAQFAVDTVNAAVGNPDDREMISAKLEARGGFAALDHRIEQMQFTEKAAAHIPMGGFIAFFGILGVLWLCTALGSFGVFDGGLDTDQMRLWI